ncbi:oxoglutarate-dependent flavonoid 7-O-demethylase 1-like [Lotus japonicus]|uniref:oxoglutarate-dependent flavonoid 7-O-demethylase 1-like n=1 Tax=Lotus japonicus TaxID=34305 RepID=UPI00258A1A8A|nr:oxoglutarate-dependent flavonoid 7-O-demethylase 1-like [Lotus japonicus]
MNLNGGDHELVIVMEEEAPSLAPSLPVPNVQEMVKKNHLQIVNHGVQNELVQRMKDVVTEFFELPIEEKEKYAMASNDIQGYGHAYVVSEEQILDWSDALMLVTNPTWHKKLQFWPKTPEGFKEIVEAYSSEVKRVGEEILSSLSLVMGLQKHVLLGLHGELLEIIRVNYYPPCSTPEKIWSNGKYKSVEHRALTNKNKRRISWAYFLIPPDDVEVEPFDHMIDAQNPKLYQKVRYGDYMRQSMKRKMEGKTHIDVAMINE